jgi:hypothetical protein
VPRRRPKTPSKTPDGEVRSTEAGFWSEADRGREKPATIDPNDPKLQPFIRALAELLAENMLREHDEA